MRCELNAKLCPCCRLPLTEAGGFFKGDDNGVYFVAGYCLRCAVLFKRLPPKAAHRYAYAAGRRILANVEKPWMVRFFTSDFEARIAAKLLTDADTPAEERLRFFDLQA